MTTPTNTPAQVWQQARELIPGLELAACTPDLERVERMTADNEYPSIRFNCTFTTPSGSAMFSYGVGIGHLPKGVRPDFNQRPTVDYVNRINNWTTHGADSYTGRAQRYRKEVAARMIKPADVLHCLLSDASVLDYQDFEEWAGEYGYDTDSRAGEQIYQDCLAQSLKFRRLFTDAQREELAELFQDY